VWLCHIECPRTPPGDDLQPSDRNGFAGWATSLHGVADQAHIRNFSIIAHIDHGKSTLADRILELTNTVDPRAMRAQVLDSMDLERERGITIKSQAVRVFYTSARDGETYQLQLIDTPGHVDFTYEVSRSLAACEGALLVVDASQGVEAQTVANTYLAVEAGLELIPCLNKVDLPGAEPERVAGEVADLLGEPADMVRRISAKTGEGISEVLDELIARVPPPAGDPDAPPRALIFDSEFDQYRGVIAYIRVVDGTFTKGEAIRAMQAGTEAEIDDIGFFTPQMTPAKALHAGEVGFLITGIKDVSALRVGDTLTTLTPPTRGATEPLPGYREVKPMVFCGLFPIESDDYPDLRDALEKLTLNDAALSWEPETSEALGFGFRCGFLGLLHMDIVRERLEREYDLELLTTMPSVEYEVTLTDGTVMPVHSPNDFPDPARVAEVREPFIRASILSPKEFVGQIMELCQERRGEHAGMHYLSAERVQLTYDLPLAEIVLDFFDQLKSRTRGYASLDYDLIGLRESDLVKLDILLAGDPIDALSMLVHRSKAQSAGRMLTEKLRAKIPRQQYDVPIQAAIGSRIVARETIKAYRKDVIAKCYGGDISRKRKLLEAQKKGKQRMKQVGRIEVPQEAFLAVLELGDAR
jgi:GTP-binding protein LepA